MRSLHISLRPFILFAVALAALSPLRAEKHGSAEGHTLHGLDADVKLDRYLGGVAGRLDARPRGAVARIDGLHRKLLAVRTYLGRAGEIRSGWTWSDAQFERFRASGEYAEALAEVEKVRTAFALLNPGYTLSVQTEVRTLSDQIGLWNTTGSVNAAGMQLLEVCRHFIVDSTLYQDTPQSADLGRFRTALRNCKVGTVPTVAVPGLSQHGQLRAFDFVVRRNGNIVAGTSTGDMGVVWDRSGWGKKLKEAVEAASSRFEGPLKSPREPWHFTYKH